VTFWKPARRDASISTLRQVDLFFSVAVLAVAANIAGTRLAARFGNVAVFRGRLLLALTGGAITLAARAALRTR